jgi:hypothetical protein
MPSNSLLYSPAQPVKVSCADLLSRAWCGNKTLLQCKLCINRLRASCWFDCMSIGKNIVMEYSHVQKWRYEEGIVWQRKASKKERNEERTSAVVQNTDWCFRIRVYNGCCTGLHNIQNSEGTGCSPRTSNSLCFSSYLILSFLTHPSIDLKNAISADPFSCAFPRHCLPRTRQQRGFLLEKC